MLRIKYNGKEIDTDNVMVSHFVDSDDLVVILNGYQIDYDAKLKEDDELYIINKGVMPDVEELEAMMKARMTPGVYDKVKKGSVAIAGLGGLGSNIAIALARTGVGRLLLVDFDTVEPSNLNRQAYGISHLGMKKIDAMKDVISDINPFISVETICKRVTEDNVLELFSGYNVVCEAFDKAESKAMLVNMLIENTDVKVVAASGMAGYESSNSIKTVRRMSRLYVCGDMENEAKEGMGLMAPRVQICAGHQANMIIRLLLELEEE